MTAPAPEQYGYREVGPGEKKPLVRAVFDRVAGRYDLMNDLMSGFLHRLWKRELVARLAPRPGQHLIDVAGGTGDVAFRLRAASVKDGTAARVTVCDINRSMLTVGRDRALDRGLVEGIDWLCGDAEALPVADGTIDGYTIAFGLRNVTDIAATLGEARRVLRPGGRYLCLEFTPEVLPALQRAYDAYSFAVLPRLGALVAGDAEPYRYLAESIRRFPNADALEIMLTEAGFARARHYRLSGGIALIHSGWRL